MNPSCIGSKAFWGDRDAVQIEQYNKICNCRQAKIDFPAEFGDCAKRMCMKYFLVSFAQERIIAANHQTHPERVRRSRQRAYALPLVATTRNVVFLF